jgi:hypothetical protein
MDIQENAIHASEDTETAQQETDLIFHPQEFLSIRGNQPAYFFFCFFSSIMVYSVTVD